MSKDKERAFTLRTGPIIPGPVLLLMFKKPRKSKGLIYSFL
jgi:hypothetical protein